ncbi:unnamed protein product [Miscanthus lutarioriparius]|uniref:RRM domain-containing protein n=1 Tax=Miscanthus lutarioriparius TaxID=422564 RepID=A0A811QNA9_9POAL|nr:unnamed protein product [Miscanthus lutarioriparius]
MPDAAGLPDDALWRPWADLPLDLLRDISRRLHATTDYVRFHATCKPWRDTLPPAPCYPAFLPWLLAPPDSAKHRMARCVFSSSRSTRRGTSAATEISVRDRRWVISLVDGTAVSTLTSICSGSGPSGSGLTAGVDVADPLTGSASSASATPLPLPPFSCDDEIKWWVDHADAVVCGDGTIFLYLFGPVHRRSYYLPVFNAALLRPGDTAWTMVHKQYLGISSIGDDPCSCIAHHDGKIVARYRNWCSHYIETRQVDHGQWVTPLPSHYGKALQASYLLESRGELLLANVLANHAHSYTIASFVDGLSVSVHALQEAEGGKTQWVKRDGPSLADRVMFLGSPSSFAVDAARFGEISGGGCAYFVLKSELYGGIWSKLAVKRCRVFKYSFLDHRSELIEQLPAEWDNDACMWLTPPQPSIASTEEIREMIEPSHTKAAGGPQFGPYFRIYVGNLPRNVDSYRLGQFFIKYGKVAEARVMCHIKTKRSRGFGFVTLATVVDHEHEQEHAIAKLDGQILDGRPVRVKFADQKQPHVAC